MLHSHYPLQALLYSVVLHRYLRWRLPGYDPERHLGGILYLYVRGMCGPETPEVDGQPVRGLRLAPAGRAWSWSSPTCSTAASRTRRWRDGRDPATQRTARDRRLALGATGLLRDLQPGRRARRGRRPRRHPARRAARRGRRAGAARGRAGRARRPPGLDLPRPRDRGRPPAGGADRTASRCRGPSRAPGCAAWAAARWCARRCCGWSAPRSTSTATGARRARSATTWSPGSVARPPEVDDAALDAGLRPRLPRRRVRRAARRRPRGRRAAGPPCSPAAPAPARPPRWPACSRWSPSSTSSPPVGRPRIALAAPTGKAAARLQEAVQEAVAPTAAPCRTRSTRTRLGGLQSSTLHRLLGWRPDSQRPLPAPPRQPAAATTWWWSTRPRWSR